MPFLAIHRNRLGYLLLGLTNNFAYVIMLTGALDLVAKFEISELQPQNLPPSNSTITPADTKKEFCNAQSTGTILLANTLPALSTKLIYPFLFVGIPVAYKACATALLSAASFLITGFSASKVPIFVGVCCASFSSGLGESTYVSNTPLYGDVALSGWSIGTGGAGLLGSAAYTLLTMILPIKIIMILMLVVPITMLVAHFIIIQPMSDSSYCCDQTENASVARVDRHGDGEFVTTLSVISTEDSREQLDLSKVPNYGGAKNESLPANPCREQNSARNCLIQDENFDIWAKIDYLPSLSKYFLPLLLVYFAEYFINQGLFEIMYFKEITFLNGKEQYRWYQTTYQLGVMISRSSLDLIRIRQIWTMSVLQAINAVLFLAHVLKFIHIPSFYIVIGIIVYEGLLGGFTYVNTFYRMKKELPPDKHEFGVSTVTIADTLGIVIAGLVAIPAHDAICKLYE